MNIKVLGTGCSKCQMLYDNAVLALSRSGIEAEIIKVTELSKISEYGVMITPALVIDKEVKSAGKIPSVEEIVGWISS